MLTLIIVILIFRWLLRPRWYRRPWGMPYGGWGLWRRPPMGPGFRGPGMDGFWGMGPGPGMGRGGFGPGPGGMGRRGW